MLRAVTSTPHSLVLSRFPRTTTCDDDDDDDDDDNDDDDDRIKVFEEPLKLYVCVQLKMFDKGFT
jgi:hypothetical protein